MQDVKVGPTLEEHIQHARTHIVIDLQSLVESGNPRIREGSAYWATKLINRLAGLMVLSRKVDPGKTRLTGARTVEMDKADERDKDLGAAMFKLMSALEMLADGHREASVGVTECIAELIDLKISLAVEESMQTGRSIPK